MIVGSVDASQVAHLADEGVKVAADMIADVASGMAPLGATGDLKASIHAESQGDGSYHVVMLWRGIFIEFGKQGYAPHPFMRPAADSI